MVRIFVNAIKRIVSAPISKLLSKLLFISALPTALATIISNPRLPHSSNTVAITNDSPQNSPNSHQAISGLLLRKPQASLFEGLEDDEENFPQPKCLSEIEPLALELLMSGIDFGLEKVVNKQLERNPQLLNMPVRKEGCLPFYYAVMSNKLQMVKILHETHGFNVSQPIAEGQGPPGLVGLDSLTLACAKNHEDLVEYFVTKTGALEQQLRYGRSENNCLRYANESVHKKIEALAPKLYSQLSSKLRQATSKPTKDSSASWVIPNVVGAAVFLAGYGIYRRQPKDEESIRETPPSQAQANRNRRDSPVKTRIRRQRVGG